jgi:cellulose biosynthesis protein BcsQ
MSATVITIATRKGGEGKSTTAMMLAWEYALAGGKALLIDMDDQPTLTYATLSREQVSQELSPDITSWRMLMKPASGIEGLNWKIDISFEARGGDGHPLYNTKHLYETAGLREWRPGQGSLDLIPGSRKLADVEANLRADFSKAAGATLGSVEKAITQAQLNARRALATARQEYGLIIIDTPAADTYAMRSALFAADGLVVPLQLNSYGENARDIMLGEIFRNHNDIRQYGLGEPLPLLKHLGTAIVMERGQWETHQRTLAIYQQKFGRELFTARVPYDAAVVQAQEFHLPVQLHLPDAEASYAAWRLSREIFQHAA